MAADFAEAAITASIDGRASPITRGWVAAVSSEQLAVLGDKRGSRTRLDTARHAVTGHESDPAWAGVGTFDSAKATAYEGDNLLGLGRYGDAVAALDKALAALEPTTHRHRCTALIDRAEAHLAADQVDASCVDAAAALSTAVHTEHLLSVQRVLHLAEAALPTKAAAARQLWADVVAMTPAFPLRNCMPGCEPANSAESTSALDGQYQGLVLDFGGVLTTSFDGALRSYCVRDGLDPDALEKIFNLDQGAQGALADLERGRISQAQFVAHIAAALSVDPDGLLERMLADLHSEPLVVAAVAQLRSRGIKVAVLSNG